MKSTATYKRGLIQAKKLARSGDYHQARQVIDQLLNDWPDNPNLLVMWADLLQLEDDENECTLDDARTNYKRAVDLNPKSPAPLIELAHFQNSVDDDPGSAVKSYDKAVALTIHSLQDALMGKAKALREVGLTEEAVQCFAQAYALQNMQGAKRSNGRSKELLKDWKAIQ